LPAPIASSVAELCRVLDIFAGARRQRSERPRPLQVGARRSHRLRPARPWQASTPSSTSYRTSLFGKSAAESADERIEGHWQAINRSSRSGSSRRPLSGRRRSMTTRSVRSLQQHLVPLLFPDAGRRSPICRKGGVPSRFIGGSTAGAQRVPRLAASTPSATTTRCASFAKASAASRSWKPILKDSRAKWLRDGRQAGSDLHGYWMHQSVLRICELSETWRTGA
jgi:hypothetical protein